MWDAILSVLKRKAAQGVQVRLIYDDLGCFFLLRPDYPRLLNTYGIHCVPFNPFRLVLTAKQNNRDHRQILSVDGKVAFTGGVNLADEYINAVDKFGHWKDTMVRLEGPGAWGLTAMFLQSWRLCTGEKEAPSRWYSPCAGTGGLVQPYCDSPMDRENVGEAVYLQIIHSARDYLYITTPYLIVDDAMVAALILAAKRGVDVRIVTPHRWDKRLVHITTRSYYRELLRGGVKILEYTPGFIHSKTFVCDDAVATVGTVNMDFRSLYLHFECGVCLYDASAVAQVRDDTRALFAQCQSITEESCRGNFLSRLVQDVMRLFAPLM
jgi:cardiolipin synthase